MIQVRDPDQIAREGSSGLPFRSRGALFAGLLTCAGALALSMIASVRFGAADLSVREVIGAFANNDGSAEDLIVRTLRVPRAIVAALVGASLGVTGALMQGMTRNPLAEPGILGVNAGGALAVVATAFLLDVSSPVAHVFAAFLGAAAAWGTVSALGTLGRGGMTPVKLTVAGAALEALLTSLVLGLLILDERTLDEVRVWLAGSVAGRDPEQMLQVLPFVALGLLLAFALGRGLTALSLGEEVAVGLGGRTAWIKAGAAVAVVMLAGSAVAVAGPILFAGLVIPHVARAIAGLDYRWSLPYSALLGAILLVTADVAGRVILSPEEVPVGVMTAFIGAPFFVYLVRRWAKR